MKSITVGLAIGLFVSLTGQASAATWNVEASGFSIPNFDFADTLTGSIEWDGNLTTGPSAFSFSWTGGDLDGQIWANTTGYIVSVFDSTTLCFGTTTSCSGQFLPDALGFFFTGGNTAFADPANSPITNTSVSVRPNGASGFLPASNPGQWTAQTTVVPAPAGIALMITWLAGFAGLRMRKKRVSLA